MRKLSAFVPLLVLVAITAPALVEAEGSEQSAFTFAGTETFHRPATAARSTELLAPRSGFLIAKIDRHRRATWRWQDVMGRRRTPTSASERESRVKAYRKWVLHMWQRRHVQARTQALHPPHESAWRCIHRYEGAWTDDGAPYYGGLQMDLGFQRRYGGSLLARKGPAGNWTPIEQMWVAERALRAGRGFYPWPNSARFCGLL